MKSNLIYHRAYEGILDSEDIVQHIGGFGINDINRVHFHWEDEKGEVLRGGSFCVDFYYSGLPWGFKDRKTRYEESLVQFKQGLFLKRYLLIQSLIDKQTSNDKVWNCFSWFKNTPPTVYLGDKLLKKQNVELSDIKIREPYPYKTLENFVDSIQKSKDGVRNVRITKNLLADRKKKSRKDRKKDRELSKELLKIFSPPEEFNIPTTTIANYGKLEKYCLKNDIRFYPLIEENQIEVKVTLGPYNYELYFDKKTERFKSFNASFLVDVGEDYPLKTLPI